MAKLKNGPVEDFVLTDWLKEGAKGMHHKMEEKRGKMKRRFQNRTRNFDTTEFRSHLRQARKEQLLAVRSLVDSALECIKGEEIGQKAPQ
ncbi:MAG: hypothetical protein JW953_18315 [Anaerolineae bacterium]|nr:hypothetical protein [Anaerolineae bacterium]